MYLIIFYYRFLQIDLQLDTLCNTLVHTYINWFIIHITIFPLYIRNTNTYLN